MMESRFWGDPSNFIDELRKRRELEKKLAERERQKKSRRHKRQVQLAKQGRR